MTDLQSLTGSIGPFRHERAPREGCGSGIHGALFEMKRARRLILAVLSAFLGSFLLVYAPEARSAGLERVSIQLKWRHQFQFAGYYAAIERGFYRQAGLDVRLVEGLPGMNFSEEVVSGRAQYGIGDPGLLLDRVNGKPVVVLAAIFQHSPEVLVARRDAGVESPADLVGRRVSLSTPGVLTIRAMFRKAGVGLDRLEIRQPDPNMDDILLGRVAARSCYLTDAPFILAQKDVAYTLLRPLNYGIDFYGDCLFTTEQEVQSRPERVRALREASLRGWRYAMSHPEELIDLIVRAYPGWLTRDQLTYEAEAMRSLMLPDLVEIGHMNPERWEQIADTFIRLGLMRSRTPLEGFLYQSNPDGGSASFHRVSMVAGFLLLVVVGTAATLGLFNRRLRQTVRQRTSELHAVNQQLRALFDHTFQFMGLLRPDGTLIEANRSALEFIHARLADVEGKLFWDTPWWNHSPEMQGRVRRAVEEAREGRAVRSEAIHLDSDGRPHTVEFSIIPIRDQSGRVVLLLPEGRDITDRKLAETAVQAERRLFIGGPVVVFHWRAEEGWPVEYVSPNSESEFGHKPVDFTSGRLPYASLIHPDDLGRVAEEVAAHSAAGVPFFEQEYRIRRADGEYRWIYDFTVTERSERGALTHYRGYVQDITERKRAEQARAELEKRLAQAQRMEAIGRLAGGIAHDFNNILTVIIGGTALIKRALVREDPLYRYVLEIEGAAERSKHITRQLLAFSRQQVMAPRVLDLNRSLKDLEATLLRLLGEDVRLELRTDPALWPVRSDPGQIDQVILNLAVNAREAMPKGGTLRIETSNVQAATVPLDAPRGCVPGDFVRLLMADDGVGIDPETLPHIFEPFFTTKRLGQGTGLGLATVYGVVEQSRGFIEVESRKGEGTTFKIHFPRSLESVQSVAEPGDVAAETRRATVLLVEDEAGVRNVAASMLKALGYSVLIAAGPDEALAFCQDESNQIDLVLTDVVMPRMSGPALKARIRKMRPGIRVLLMSGYPSDLLDGSESGQAEPDFIQKPFSLSSLSAKLHQMMAPAPKEG